MQKSLRKRNLGEPKNIADIGFNDDSLEIKYTS